MLAEIYYEELAHVIMGPEKFRSLYARAETQKSMGTAPF